MSVNIYKQGELVPIASGGGEDVPIATTAITGKVKPDGSSIVITQDGTISSTQNTPIATTQEAGKVKPDGNSIIVTNDGTISTYDFVGTREEVASVLNNLPEGTTIYITDDNTPGNLPIATTETLGGVKPDGTTITVTQDGTISSVGGGSETPIATTETAGKVKPDGTTITVTQDGTISGADATPIATTSVAGKVKPDGSSITIDSNGIISANATVPIATTNIVGGIKASNIKDITVNSAGALSIDPYYYKLDRRKIFPQGRSAYYSSDFLTLSNNTLTNITPNFNCSGLYFISIVVNGLGSSGTIGGLVFVSIYDQNDNEIMANSYHYCNYYAPNTSVIVPNPININDHYILPIQKGEQFKIKVNNFGTNISARLFGTLIYDFTNTTVDTSHWWNNSDVIS